MRKTRFWHQLGFALRLRRHSATEWLPTEFQVRRSYFFGFMSEFSHPTVQFCQIAAERDIVYRIGKNQHVMFCHASDHAKFLDIIEAMRTSFTGMTYQRGRFGWFTEWLDAAGIRYVRCSIFDGVNLTRTQDIVEVLLRFEHSEHEIFSRTGWPCYKVVQPEE